MNTHAPYVSTEGRSLLQGFSTRHRVIGALLLRDVHTRYGRDNIGYLWLVAEPMLFASVIGSIHLATISSEHSGMSSVAVAVLGYTVFIMFRGIVNRSEGLMEGGNSSLLYHRMVSIEDVVFSRAILEGAGTAVAIMIMLTFLTLLGFTDPPARPLYLFAGVFFQFWLSLAQSMLVVAIAHDNRTFGRMVHIYTYFMIPLSGAFTPMLWLPHPYRDYLLWLPMPHIFEMVRYGEFAAASDAFFNTLYLTGWCLGLTLFGLLALRMLRKSMHAA